MLIRKFVMLLIGATALATLVAAQSTPPPAAITRAVIATTKLLTVTAVPLYFRAVSVTLPPGGKTALSASSGILYQVSGSTEITLDEQSRTLTSGEGSFIAAGRTTTLKATGEASSAFLHFFLGTAVDLDQPAYAAPATVRELYRTSAPIPGLKPGNYDINLTRITFPPQMPSNPPHHRSGAALYTSSQGSARTRWAVRPRRRDPDHWSMNRSTSSTNGEILAVSRSPSWLSTSTLKALPLCFPAHPPKLNRPGSAGLDWLLLASPIGPSDGSRGAR